MFPSIYSLRPALGVPVESGTYFKKVFECVINKCCSGYWDPLLIECIINKCYSGCWDPLLTLFTYFVGIFLLVYPNQDS